MDVKRELRVQIDRQGLSTCSGLELFDLCTTALRTIEHLEKYAQHQPSCALVSFRLIARGWITPQPESPPCSCGLVPP